MELWTRERSTEQLTAIPNELVQELATYASDIRRQIRLTDRDSITAALKSAELEMLQRLLKSLLEVRFRKILAAVLKGEEPENLTPFEKRVFHSLQRTIDEYMDSIDMMARQLRMTFMETDSKYDVVSFLQPVGRFVGEDLKSYGPFKQGDIAILPVENARSLAKRSIVKRIILY